MQSRKLSFAILLVAGFSFQMLAQKPVTIGVVMDGYWERNAALVQMFQSEILDLTRGEFDIRFPADKTLTADWTSAGVENALQQLLGDPAVDIVLTMGVIASHKASQQRNLPKPVLAPFVIDMELQNLPSKEGASGVKNLNYIAIPNTLERDIAAFKEITPFSEVLVFLNGAFSEALPDMEKRVKETLAELGVVPLVVPVYTVDDALNALQPDVQAVYLAPLIHLPNGEIDRIIAQINANNLPSFSLFGQQDVERGVLASLNPDIFPRMSRRVALNVQRVLLGEDAGTIPYAFPSAQELRINMATAREIGVYPPWGTITDAILIQEQREEVTRNLHLGSAVQEGISVNLDLLAKNQEVLAGRQNIREALGVLLPQIDVSATAVQIDADRAGSFQAEKTLTGSATVTQLIFSDDALTNHTVQKNLQKSLEFDRDALRLDIAREIAVAYLQLLSAKTFENIQKNNLRLSRSNLELARVRESIGASGLAEVYRWESEIASNRGDVIRANTLRNIAEMQLNRLLHRPLEEKFNTAESGLDQSQLLTPHQHILKYMQNPWAFKTLRIFLTQEGIAASPEIQQLDASIAVQERLLKNTTRSLFLPTLAAQAEISNKFYTGGKGSAPFNLNDPQLAPFATLLEGFDTGDDVNWNVALNLSFPLYNGGSKYAQRSKAVETLAQLRIQRKSLVDKIEQRIRTAAHNTGASYAGIEQSNKASAAAAKNLELVVDAYSRGVLSITQLLDAQNAALIAEEAAANAVYNFLIDLMNLQRSIGINQYIEDAGKIEALYQRLETYFESVGVNVR